MSEPVLTKASSPSPPSGRPGERGWLPWLALAVILLASAAIVFWAGRGTVFRGDDWDLLLYRGGFSWDVFLVPHNEHLSALLVAAYKAIPALVGPHYAAFRATLLIMDVAVAILFFLFARERVGDRLALLATAPLLLLGAGSDNLLWPTQIGVVGSLACGIATLIVFDREGLPAKLGACALLTAGIWFSSDGLFFLACIGIWLALSPRRWRDAWILAIPAITYVAWYSGHGVPDFTAANLRASPGFIADSAVGGFNALTGIGFSIGHAKAIGALGCLVGLAALIAFAVRGRPALTPRLMAVCALPVVSWILIAFGRADGGDPFASRYVYASAVFILMAALELLRGERLPRLLRGWKVALVALAVLFSVLLDVRLLVEAGNQWRAVSQYIRGRTAAIELTRRTVDPNLPLEPLPDMGHMTAGWFLNDVDKYGLSPTGSPDIAGLDAQGRLAADQVLVAAAPARFVTPPPGAIPTGPAPTPAPGSTDLSRRGSCLLGLPESTARIEVPKGGVLIDPRGGGSATVSLRRFSPGFLGAPGKTIDAPTLLVIPGDHSPVPWHAQIASEGRVSICATMAPSALREGPKRPSHGDQHCAPMSIAEPECKFSRY